MSDLLQLIKIGQKAHLERFRLNGEMRFGLFSDYQKTENDNEARNDEFDGVARIKNQEGGFVNLKFKGGPWHQLSIIQANFKETYSDLAVFCMTAITSEIIDQPISEKLISIEENDPHIVLIHPGRFFYILGQYLRDNGIAFKRDYVTYQNVDYSSDTEPFVKREKYSYQHEYRICIEKKTLDEHQKVYLGDLSDCVSEPYQLPTDGRKVKLTLDNTL